MNEGFKSSLVVENDGQPLNASVYAALLTDLPRARGLNEALVIADSARKTLIGPGLLTVNLRCDPALTGDEADATVTLQRIWSSDPEAYPVAGQKKKKLTPWTHHLLIKGEVFVGEGCAALQAVFEDHALIASLQLQAVINVPVFNGRGECFATFNVLGGAPQWKPEDVSLARLLAALCSPAIFQATTNNLK